MTRLLRAAAGVGCPVSFRFLLLVCAAIAAGPLQAGEVTPQARTRLALTFDDLPWVGALPSGRSTQSAIESMMDALDAHAAPATGFVVCDKARLEPAALEIWTARGYNLGNHTSRHLDLHRTPVQEWISGVRDCDHYLKRYGKAYIRQFRYPLLHQGNTDAKYQVAADAIDALGLQRAHVTVDTSEWILTQAHAAASKRGDANLRREVGDAFVAHILAALEHAESVASRKLKRSIPHVLLLHANALVAEHLDDLLDALKTRGVDFIPLAAALQDPVFDLTDEYRGPQGLSWLYRIGPMNNEDSAWDDAQAEQIRSRFADLLADTPP